MYIKIKINIVQITSYYMDNIFSIYYTIFGKGERIYTYICISQQKIIL